MVVSVYDATVVPLYVKYGPLYPVVGLNVSGVSVYACISSSQPKRPMPMGGSGLIGSGLMVTGGGCTSTRPLPASTVPGFNPGTVNGTAVSTDKSCVWFPNWLKLANLK